MILGVGINVYPPRGGFPRELEKTAGAVFQEKKSDGKNRLAAGFLNAFMELYRGKTEQDHVREYRDRSLVLGKDIQVLLPEGPRKAKAVDIDQDCRLEVEYEDGSREKLAAGEIRILI